MTVFSPAIQGHSAQEVDDRLASGFGDGAPWTDDGAGLPPAMRTIAARIALHLLVIAGCVGVAGLLLLPGVAISATAAAWIQAIGRDGADIDVMGLLLQRLIKAGMQANSAVGLVQLLVASTLLYLTARVGHRLLGAWAAAGTVLALLVWPVGRATVTVLSVESMLALATMAMMHGGLALETTPRRAALWLALGLALLVLLHPVALAVAPCAAVVVLLLPAPQRQREVDTRLGPATRPVWLPWLAALALGLTVAAILLPNGELKNGWARDLAALRAPSARLASGWLASLPVLGPIVLWLGQLPFLVLLALGQAASKVRRQPSLPGTLAVALALVWLFVLAVVGLPVPGMLDGIAILAPLLAIIAIGEGMAIARTVADSSMPRVTGSLLVVTAVATLLTDTWLQRDDRRNALGHVAGVLLPVDAALPAILDADDVDLLRRFPEAAALLPARQGGHHVGAALKILNPELHNVAYGAAYASRLALLPIRPVHPVDVAFAAHGTPLACSVRHCLVRLRGRPD